MRSAAPLFFRRTCVSFLGAGKLSQYEQEAFEAHRRLVESKTYVGSIRAATPGDTRFYDGSVETILGENERHYWRAVTDDPRVEFLIPLRIRFKTNVWVTTGWEQRMQVVQVMAPRDATVSEVMDLVRVENSSPYLCQSEFKLTIEGKELDSLSSIASYNITENTQLDAVESEDHLQHTDAVRPKDWNLDELSAHDMAQSPYKEMAPNAPANLAPRYEGRPTGFFGKNNYSGMKRTSS